MAAVFCFSWCARYHPSSTHKYGHVQADQLTLAPPSRSSVLLPLHFLSPLSPLLLLSPPTHRESPPMFCTPSHPKTLTVSLYSVRVHIHHLIPICNSWENLSISSFLQPPMVGVAPFVCMAPMRVACALAIPQFAAPAPKISSTSGYLHCSA